MMFVRVLLGLSNKATIASVSYSMISATEFTLYPCWSRSNCTYKFMTLPMLLLVSMQAFSITIYLNLMVQILSYVVTVNCLDHESIFKASTSSRLSLHDQSLDPLRPHISANCNVILQQGGSSYCKLISRIWIVLVFWQLCVLGLGYRKQRPWPHHFRNYDHTSSMYISPTSFVGAKVAGMVGVSNRSTFLLASILAHCRFPKFGWAITTLVYCPLI